MNKKMYELGSKRSVIRELFEYGKEYAEVHGKDSVFDFTIGNPNVPTPHTVNDLIKRAVDNPDIHLYTSAEGDKEVRKKISAYIKKEFSADMPAQNIYMTTGAAAALSIVFKALVDEERNEFIVFAPYFPEYKVFVEAAGGVLNVQCAAENFGFNLEGLEKLITPRTVGVIINSPSNPTGRIYSKEELSHLFEMISKRSTKEKPIYVIADEPYRELGYDDTEVPYIPNLYDNSIVCYSWSKTLSLAGERIGYIAVSPKAQNDRELFLTICGAGRALGYVCASSLFQYVVSESLGLTADIEIYKHNRDRLYGALKEYGFTLIEPKGAFYMFMKSPLPNDDFMKIAKSLGILFVPSETFGVDNWVRIAYCVSPDVIEGSLPHFKKLAEICGLKKE